MPGESAPATIDYDKARVSIEDGDVLFYRATSVVPGEPNWLSSQLQAEFTPGDFSHAGKLGWWGDTLMAPQCREWVGGMIPTLRSEVRKYSGRITVWRPRCSPATRHLSLVYARRLSGHRYAYWAVVLIALLHLPVIYAIARACGWKPDWRRRCKWDDPLFCSGMVLFVDRLAAEFNREDFDPLSGYGELAVPPSLLANSGYYEPLFDGRALVVCDK